MAIYARKRQSNFTPAPEGLHAAVCCDVWEPWTEERAQEWGGGLVDKTRIVWLIEEINPKTGKPFEASQIYTLSLHEKSKMCAHLEAWRGRKFTAEEKKGFDLEKLIGAPCQVQVVHKITEDATYANVQTIVPLGKGQTRIVVPKDYQRHKDRTPNNAPSDQSAEFVASDDDVPF